MTGTGGQSPRPPRRRSPPPRRESPPRQESSAQVSIWKNELEFKKDNRVVPAHSARDYNRAVVDCVPRSVHGMKVTF